MGKQKRQRRKFHIEAKNVSLAPEDSSYNKPESAKSSVFSASPIPPLDTSKNIFSGLKIDVLSLSQLSKSDEMPSVKLFTSVRPPTEKILGKSKSIGTISKKEKLKKRRQMLLKKIDTVAQLKKENAKKAKRAKTAIIGDINPLKDALPSLESLLKSRPKVDYKQNATGPTKKGIEKLSKKRKTYLEGINMFKKINSNKNIKKNPFETISQHLKDVVKFENENSNSTKK